MPRRGKSKTKASDIPSRGAFAGRSFGSSPSGTLDSVTPPARRRVKASDLGLLPRKTARSAVQSWNRSSAMDYFTNAFARMGWGTESLPEGTAYDLVRLSNNYYLLLTLYRNHWLARRIVDLPAIDMTRAWPKLACELPPDDIKKFDRTVSRTYTPMQVRTAIKWARLYGGAGALIVIKGHEKYLEEPLDLEDVTPGSYQGLIPFDRWVGIYPTGNITEGIGHPSDWGMPEFYEVRGPDSAQEFKVHASRILRFLGPTVPAPEYQAQMYWGLSMLEVCYEELRKRDNASWAILNLMFRANLIAQVNPQLAPMLAGLGTSQSALQNYQRIMEAQNHLISSQSMLILPEGSEMQSVQYAFGGMAEVYAQFQMDTSGAAEIPVTRLFGRTITGLGQSNDADERLYEEKIAADQNEQVRPQLDKLYPVICMSEFGEVPDDLDFKFPSIRVLTEEDKADKADKVAAPIIAAYNSGLLGRKTALKELKQLGDTTEVFTNITEETIDEASDEPDMMGEEMEQGPPGGNPGSKARPNPSRVEKQFAAGAEDSISLTAAAQARRWIKWHGMDITIENHRRSTRSGFAPDGKMWNVTLTEDYGYLQRTKGADGDQLDVFVGSQPAAANVYIVHTLKAPAFVEYDEDKCMLDFPSPEAAKAAFLENYDRPEHFGSMDVVPVKDFATAWNPDGKFTLEFQQ